MALIRRIAQFPRVVEAASAAMSPTASASTCMRLGGLPHLVEPRQRLATITIYLRE